MNEEKGVNERRKQEKVEEPGTPFGLASLRDYLRQRGQATLAEVANHFRIPPEVARQMLEVWLRKGRVRRRWATASCGSGCSQCDPAATEIYEWGDSGEKSGPLPHGCPASRFQR